MENIYDLIIIGGGPAGITAGIYVARQNLKSLLITKSFGGQISRKTVEVENYPGADGITGADLIQKFENHLKKQKISIENDNVSKLEKNGEIFSVMTAVGKVFSAKSVIVASGSEPRILNIPGEKEFLGKGVSYCPLCDGPIFSGKNVAVIGGGNCALEAAIFLSNYVSKIYMVERGNSVRGDQTTKDKLMAIGKTEIITNAGIKEIKGEKFVSHIVFEDLQNKKEKALEVSGVFVEIGNTPAVEFVKDLVDFNEKKEIVKDSKNCQTKTHGLFAAGDVSDTLYKQIIIAAGEGAKAALSAYNFIKK
jgi:thioredoxin-disulfide reductase